MATIAAASPSTARSVVAVANLPSIFVHVVNAQSELPVAGAEVVVAFLEGDPDHPIVTGVVYNAMANPGGHIFLDGLKPGLYVVTVSARGYAPFGDPGNVDRPPTGRFLVLSLVHHGPAHVAVSLVPLCGDCHPPGS